MQSYLLIQQAPSTATEVCSKETYLKTWNSLLKYNRSLNMQLNRFFSFCNASDFSLQCLSEAIKNSPHSPG